jgi:uncharacterized membrane protein YfcA
VLALLPIAFLAALAGAANSIAGGGTLITFPALIGLGISPIIANATSTVALVPGSLSSMIGYRNAIVDRRMWLTAFAIPSVMGGVVGAWLLTITPDEQFAHLVPFLVLGATVLFLTQRPILAAINRVRTAPIGEPKPGPAFFAVQFFVAVYGGYFGAAAGIIMLAALGLIGLRDIHQMNGLKNWAAVCFNGVAATVFILSGLVNWPIALVMAVGAGIGGWTASRVAQRIPREYVRAAVGFIGLAAAAWLFLR